MTTREPRPMNKVVAHAIRVQRVSTLLVLWVWFPVLLIAGVLYWYVLNQASWLTLALLEWFGIGCILVGFIFGTQSIIAFWARIYESLIVLVPITIMSFWAGAKMTGRIIEEITEPAGGAYVSPAAVETSAHP